VGGCLSVHLPIVRGLHHDTARAVGHARKSISTVLHVNRKTLTVFSPSFISSLPPRHLRAPVCTGICFSPFLSRFSQDVTSYIIARTLGVIDDTKASTSDRESLHPVAVVEGAHTKPPAIIVQSASMPISPSVPADAGQPLGEMGEKLRLEIGCSRSHLHQSESSSSLYEGNPALAGVGVFSPAASTPPSPTLERRRVGSLSMSSTIMTPLNQLDNDNWSSEKVTTDGEGEEEVIKSRVGRKGSWGSMSAGLDSSYALIDRDSGSEDSGVPLRRRQKVPTMEPIDP
jgi:hypothetical protein